jgi:hypothetical protein
MVSLFVILRLKLAALPHYLTVVHYEDMNVYWTM